MPDAASQTAALRRAGRRRPRENEPLDPGMSSAKVVSKLAQRRHSARVQQLRKAVQMRSGYVEEPFMTPLVALNMLFRNLLVAEADVNETRAAVDAVVADVTEQQSSQMASQTRRSVRNSSVRHSQQASLRASIGTVLNSQVTMSLLSASQDPLRSPLSTQNELEAHSRKALALDVIETLCTERGLIVERMNWRNLRRQGDRIGAADVSAHQRALVVVDLYEPFFVLVLAHAPPEAGARTGSDDIPGSQPASAAPQSTTAASSSTLQFLQLVSAAQHPTPWRAVFKNQTRHLPHNQCAVAAVYRDNQTPRSASQPRTEHEVAKDTLLGGSQSQPHLSPADDGLKAQEVPLRGTSGEAPLLPALPEVEITVDQDWSVQAARFTQEEAVQDDPFHSIPRIERRGARGQWRRAWTQRLRKIR